MQRLQIIDGKLAIFSSNGEYWRSIKTEAIARAILIYNGLGHILPSLLLGASVYVDYLDLRDSDADFRSKIRAIRAEIASSLVPSFYKVDPLESKVYVRDNVAYLEDEFKSTVMADLHRDLISLTKGNVAIQGNFVALPSKGITRSRLAHLLPVGVPKRGVRAYIIPNESDLLIYKIEISI